MHRPRIEGRLLMINHDASFRRRFLLSQLAVQRVKVKRRAPSPPG